MTPQISIPLDPDSLAGLEDIAREGGHPSVPVLAGSILREVVADDRAAHEAPADPVPAAKIRRQGVMWWIVGESGERLDGPFGSRKAAEGALP